MFLSFPSSVLLVIDRWIGSSPLACRQALKLGSLNQEALDFVESEIVVSPYYLEAEHSQVFVEQFSALLPLSPACDSLDSSSSFKHHVLTCQIHSFQLPRSKDYSFHSFAPKETDKSCRSRSKFETVCSIQTLACVC